MGVDILAIHTDAAWSIGTVMPTFSELNNQISNDKHVVETGFPKLTLDNAILTMPGKFVQLDFSRIEKDVSLIPGGLIQVYGRNPTGSLIHVESVDWDVD